MPLCNRRRPGRTLALGWVPSGLAWGGGFLLGLSLQGVLSRWLRLGLCPAPAWFGVGIHNPPGWPSQRGSLRATTKRYPTVSTWYSKVPLDSRYGSACAYLSKQQAVELPYLQSVEIHHSHYPDGREHLRIVGQQQAVDLPYSQTAGRATPSPIW